jgi:hypothetical protein
VGWSKTELLDVARARHQHALRSGKFECAEVVQSTAVVLRPLPDPGASETVPRLRPAGLFDTLRENPIVYSFVSSR